jgi:arsenite methyltransferase
MHLALSARPELRQEDYRTQTAFVADLILETGARRVLELGCRLGFNLLELARLCPQVEIVGIDLLERHVRKARARSWRHTNVSVLVGSHDRLPPEIGTFDLVFAVETLCYATDRPAVAASIAQVLAPDGRLVVFDAERVSGFSSLSSDMQLAAMLYEAVTVVEDGFGTADAWADAYMSAGLITQRLEDMSQATIPGLRRLHRYGARCFSDPVVHAATSPLPWASKATAVGALLGPSLIEGDFEGGRWQCRSRNSVSPARLQQTAIPLRRFPDGVRRSLRKHQDRNASR